MGNVYPAIFMFVFPIPDVLTELGIRSDLISLPEVRQDVLTGLSSCREFSHLGSDPIVELGNVAREQQHLLAGKPRLACLGYELLLPSYPGKFER